MKRILLLLLTTFILADCSDRDKGFGLKVSKDLISWTNGSVRFEAEKKTSGKRNPNPAFQLYIRDQHGKEIQMPFDTYALGYGASCPMGNSGLASKTASAAASAIGREVGRQLIRGLFGTLKK